MCLYVRELKMDEGQKIQRILRRSTNRVKVRRAQVVLASEQGYIECQFTHVKEFVIRGTNYQNHNELKIALNKYVRYCNKHTQQK